VDLDPGIDFVEAIETSVSSCDVLIAVIGKRWLLSSVGRGKRRLENPEDLVRVEIATALKRKIRVIPVLVDGASMPRSGDLPDDLKLLARRNALEVSHNRFNTDFGRLVSTIESVLEEADAERNQRQVTPKPTPTTMGDAEAALTRGNACYEKNDYDKAISDYNEAIRLNPNNAKAYKERGWAYSCNNEYDKAISDYTEAIGLDPNDAWAYNNRGEAYESQGKLDMAKADFAKADELEKAGQ
jgi:tetratricopeptide (TPR) repeat protein